MAPKDRLILIDRLLHEGWHSFFDFALAIYAGPNKVMNVFHYYSDFKDCEIRGSIAQDFRRIQEIWAFTHLGETIKTGHDKSKKNPIRTEVNNRLFNLRKRPQFTSSKVPELYSEKEKIYKSNPTVIFYKYKDPKYSLFKSGDYDRFVAFQTRKKNTKSLEDSLNKTVTDSEVNQAQFDPGFVPEFEVSAQIRRSILLQDELKEFEKGSKHIVESLLEKISTETDQKKRRWVQKTVNYYRNILELVKNPLSNYNPREIADQIHEFAFFLASENQYHLLGKRFDEALAIYQKLRREQRHLIEDIEKGLVTEEEANIDRVQAKEQMAKDDESVAAILMSMARVRLDSGEVDSAKTALEQAKALSGKPSLVNAQVCHLESIIAGLEGNIERAAGLIEEAYGTIQMLNLEDSSESAAILASKAELLQRTGDTEGAKALYESLIAKDDADETVCEARVSTALSLAIINLSEGQIEDADKNVSIALSGFEKMIETEPDKNLPNLMTAKYIKGLVLMHSGDLMGAIAILEEASTMVPETRLDLFALCGTELLEINVTLHDLYVGLGDNAKAEAASGKAKQILSSIGSIIPDEERASILERL